MQILNYVAMSLVGLSAPASALTCYEPEEFMEHMTTQGFHVTFSDTSGEWAMFMMEDGKGRWSMLALNDEMLCDIAGGAEGNHIPLPPNA